MTLEEKFSPAWGFEKGVVVEFTTCAGSRSVGYFVALNRNALSLDLHTSPGHGISMDYEAIQSLRILTPPWSAWLFAPVDNADIVGVYVDMNDMYPMHFATVDPRKDSTDPWVDGQGIRYLPHPWWLDHGPMED